MDAGDTVMFDPIDLQPIADAIFYGMMTLGFCYVVGKMIEGIGSRK